MDDSLFGSVAFDHAGVRCVLNGYRAAEDEYSRNPISGDEVMVTSLWFHLLQKMS